MSVKKNNGTAVAIEHLPEDGKDDILKVGTDVWNALVPNLVHEEPIAVSVGLLQPRTETGKHGARPSSSAVCSAVPSKDVQVSDRLYGVL
jgi:hypothetical protein